MPGRTDEETSTARRLFTSMIEFFIVPASFLRGIFATNNHHCFGQLWCDIACFIDRCVEQRSVLEAN